MKLYIAGPMTGLPEYNYPAFDKAEAKLKELGYVVESPAAAGQVNDWDWSDYMRRGLKQLLECDGVALLPDWEKSKGATLEYHVATKLDMRVMQLDTWLALDTLK